ncbi:MAG: hypothetical protein WA790_11095 [Sulfitobacter sp.]
MKMLITAVSFVLFLSLSGPVFAKSAVETIKEELSELSEDSFGCSKVLKRLKTFRRKYPEFHFYFAGRKDDTRTGIRGCGYGFNSDPEKAKADALKHCKKWEVNYGTDGGKKICHFIK